MAQTDWFRNLGYGWRLLRNAWRPMAGYLLIVWLLSLALLTPLTSWMLSQLMSISGMLVIGNTEMVGWFLSPKGMLFLVLSGSFVLLSLTIQMAGLIWIVRESITHGLLRIKPIFMRHFYALPQLFRFSAAAFLLVIVLILPLGAGLGAIYRALLSDHDINFYLTTTPAAWRYAVVILPGKGSQHQNHSGGN